MLNHINNKKSIKYILTLSSSLLIGFSQLLQAQPSCIPATTNDYEALIFSTGLNREDLMKKLTIKYCYDLENFNFNKINKPHPIFFSPTPIFLNYYIKTSRNFIDLKEPEYNLDILSYLLILPYGSYSTISNEQKNEVLKKIYVYDHNVKASWFLNKYQTIDNNGQEYKDYEIWNNHQKMINLLAPYYSNLLTHPVDDKENTALNYAIITNQAIVVESILKSPYYNFYKINKDGYTPFHLAFSKKFFAGDKQQKEKNILRINQLLIENFKPERTSFLDLNGVSFNQFIKMMREFNPNLYELIIQKQKDIGINVDNINTDLVLDYKEHYIKTMSDYIENKE